MNAIATIVVYIVKENRPKTLITHINPIQSVLDIIVVNEPICQSRYGIEHRIDGYEIYTGHHRAACAVFLGMPTLWVIIARDIAEHTSFKKRIEDLAIDAQHF